jgi:hypothetical protein
MRSTKSTLGLPLQHKRLRDCSEMTPGTFTTVKSWASETGVEWEQTWKTTLVGAA